MKKYIIILSLLLSACGSTKVELSKKIVDTEIDVVKYKFDYFQDAFQAFHPEEAFELAETESQKLAAKALNYVSQSRYEDAVDTFVEAMLQKNSWERLWKYFPWKYYSCINYNWEKLEEYENIRNDIGDSSFIFYKDKPEFQIDFLEDSVVIPIKLSSGLPIIKIKINGKYYSFLIDTGCGATLIGRNLATENNIVYENKELTGNAVDGEFTIFNAFMPELDLEQIKISNIPLQGRNENDAFRVKILFITWFKCDGVLGWDLLSKFDFTIDYKNEQLILRKPIEKNVAQRNLFWYGIPFVKFYFNAQPLLAFLDTGAGSTYFYQHPTLSQIIKIDTNNLKKSSDRGYGAANKSVKTYYYKYPNFQCYTITNNEISYLTANEVSLVTTEDWRNSPIILEGTLGSDWFKDKAIRVDIANGLFEISE